MGHYEQFPVAVMRTTHTHVQNSFKYPVYIYKIDILYIAPNFLLAHLTLKSEKTKTKTYDQILKSFFSKMVFFPKTRNSSRSI